MDSSARGGLKSGKRRARLVWEKKILIQEGRRERLHFWNPAFEGGAAKQEGS